MHLHLNPLGGLAGDMFCAGLLDAYPHLLPEVREVVAGLALPIPVQIQVAAQPGTLRGRRFLVRPKEDVASTDHSHTHTPFAAIRRLLEAAPLTDGVRRRAITIFSLLAGAEGRVHGVPAEDVTFHEVGAWDSIADIVAAATLLEALGVQGASTAPLPLGGGRVTTAHGVLPVPAPATASLLEDLPVADDGVSGERVTPTGAAILQSLQPLSPVPPPGRLRVVGMGFGSRRLEGVPNCLQVLCIEPVAGAPDDFAPDFDQVTSLRFEVDDQSGEDLALGLDRIRGTAGVLSITTLQGIGKGGRPTMSVEVLARPAQVPVVARACFRETSTIGLRWQPVSRMTLSRRQGRVEVDGQALDVKLVQRPDGPDAKVEARDLTSAAGRRERSRLARAGVAAALGDGHD